MTKKKLCSVGLVGPGLIGRTFLRQLAEQGPYLRQMLGFDVSVVAISNSRTMLLAQGALQATDDWAAALAGQGRPSDLDALAQHVSCSAASCAVIVDCTASDAVADAYAGWLARGCHVVTPNKRAGAGPLHRYQRLRELQAAGGQHWLYEATVGAGLPVVSTLRALLDSGDRVVDVQGVLSGTLSFIFNRLAPGVPFSSVVREAKAAGYTEPDPREDLSGADVARKVVILARECGLQLEVGALAVASLVPAALAGPDVSADAFLERLPEFDAEMAAEAEAAAAAGEVVRYVGVVDVEQRTASVKLARYPRSHPLAQLQGSDNLVAITTLRYPPSQPLIVRGPGAGAEVTAGGVMADLVTLLRCCGGGPALPAPLPVLEART